MVLVAVLSVGLTFPEVFQIAVICFVTLVLSFLLLASLIALVVLLSMPGLLLCHSMVISVVHWRAKRRQRREAASHITDAEIRYL
jgi:hypothetical protein